MIPGVYSMPSEGDVESSEGGSRRTRGSTIGIGSGTISSDLASGRLLQAEAGGGDAAWTAGDDDDEDDGMDSADDADALADLEQEEEDHDDEEVHYDALEPDDEDEDGGSRRVG